MHDFLKKCIVFILTWEARAVLTRYKPRIIAVTGSVGKTTTKEDIYVELSRDLYVRKRQKSMNSEIGVPLTILGLENAWNSPFKWLLNILRGLWLVVARLSYPPWLPPQGGPA